MSRGMAERAGGGALAGITPGIPGLIRATLLSAARAWAAACASGVRDLSFFGKSSSEGFFRRTKLGFLGLAELWNSDSLGKQQSSTAISWPRGF